MASFCSLFVVVSVSIGFLSTSGYGLNPRRSDELYCKRFCFGQRRPVDCHFRCRHFFLAIARDSTCGKSMLWLQNDTCEAVASRFGVDVQQMEGLNTNLHCNADMTQFVGTPVCLKKLAVGARWKVEFCDLFHVALGGETCDQSAQRHPTPIDIAAMNPEINCNEKLIAGEILCASVFAAPMCEQFHLVVTSDETCESIRVKWDLKSVATLTSINSDLNCTKHMEVGRLICVNIFAMETA